MPYRLYIDESGDHVYHQKDESPASRYLCLLGCIIDGERYRQYCHPDMAALKQKYFNSDPDKPVIFHRKEMMQKSGVFWRLRDPEVARAFDTDLLHYFKAQQYTIIAIVIDKKEHLERYGKKALHPYHYCLTLMLERYCGFLANKKSVGDVMAEGREKQENEQLKQEYRAIYHSGSYHRQSEFFQNALTSGELKIREKRANIAGLQLADLLAYPCKQDVLMRHKCIPQPPDSYGTQIIRVAETKYNRRYHEGEIQIDGYGCVLLRPPK